MEIASDVWEIIESIKNKRITERNNDEWLTGTVYNFDGIDMVYLVLELQKRYNIFFEKADFDSYRFATVNGIVDIVRGYC